MVAFADEESGGAADDHAVVADAASAASPGGASSDHSSNANGAKPAPRKLSTFSRLYDVDGDGRLDDAELAVMALDASRKGFVSNDRVYGLMEQHMELQRELFRKRRVIFVLVALVAILALSNLGTSFAAAALAKDTTHSENAEVLDRWTGEQLSTQTGTSRYGIELSAIESDGAAEDGSGGGGGGGGGGGSLTMDAESCEHMFEQCRRGNSVTLVRPFPEAGQDSMIRLCPFRHGTLSRHDRSVVTTADGESVTIEHAAEGHCTISGEAVTSKEGGTCEGDFDCGEGMECRRSEGLIAECRQRCALRRWAQSLVEECQDDCDHTTCQAADSEGRE